MSEELFDVTGRVALVTGGSRGIGRMMAEGLVDGGADVILAARKEHELAETAESLNVRAGRDAARPITSDLSSEEGCRMLADSVRELTPKLDILVNNAGATWGAPLDEHDQASWDRVLNLNVAAPFHVTKFCLPLLQASGTHLPTRVINVGSIDGLHVPMLETYSYSASKAAVHQLTRHLASQLAPTTTVNAVAPGPFESKMMAATLDSFGEQIAASAPLKRIGRPSDMAGVVRFLASEAGAYVTGAVIPVDGGIATLA